MMVHRLFSCFCTKRRRSSRHTTTAYQTPEEFRKGGPVVVELFSSQGCMESQEAEQLFSKLGKGDLDVEVPVILMAYHVDYLDHNGWKDPFASSQWTVRQKSYVETFNLDIMFTPQVIVQGRTQCVANDRQSLLSSIASATRYPPMAFQATFQRATPVSLQISLSGALRAKVDSKGADIMVALYESGLTTNCLRGANKGRVLANDFVVRRLRRLCSIKDFSAKKTLTGSMAFDIWPGFISTKCGIVVFVQQHVSHHIFGSQRFQLPKNL